MFSFIKHNNILNYNLNNSCIISSFYTIQFISPKRHVINKIFKCLNWGGAFLIEKVRGPDARFQDIFNQGGHNVEYKLNKGYTAEEIINKAIVKSM